MDTLQPRTDAADHLGRQITGERAWTRDSAVLTREKGSSRTLMVAAALIADRTVPAELRHDIGGMRTEVERAVQP